MSTDDVIDSVRPDLDDAAYLFGFLKGLVCLACLDALATGDPPDRELCAECVRKVLAADRERVNRVCESEESQ